jgi:hypothetical protein
VAGDHTYFVGVAGVWVHNVPCVDLATLADKEIPIGQQTLARYNVGAIANDGTEGEIVAAKLLKDTTGLEFKTIQNASRNGADGVAVDDAAKVIYGAEVKSSIKGNFPDADSLNLPAKFDAWIRNAARGTLNKQTLDPDTIKFAEELVKKLDAGYTIKPFMVKVAVPMPGTTGPATAIIVPVK